MTKRSDASAASPDAGSSPTTRCGGSRSGRPTPTLVDDWLAELFGDPAGVALLAVGAYGRRELCPASDLDLVLVHDGKRGRDLGELADASGTRSGTRARARPQRAHAEGGASPSPTAT